MKTDSTQNEILATRLLVFTENSGFHYVYNTDCWFFFFAVSGMSERGQRSTLILYTLDSEQSKARMYSVLLNDFFFFFLFFHVTTSLLEILLRFSRAAPFSKKVLDFVGAYEVRGHVSL